LSRDFDAVIDEVNTIPFFTPIWARVPTFMLIHQLAREVWWYESAFPLAAVGYFAEPVYLLCYRNSSVFTVSDSTASDLRRFGFRGPVTVVSEGLEPMTAEAQQKAGVPTFIYVGRLSPSKRVSDAIRGFALFLNRAEISAELWIIGDGKPNYVASLRALTKELGLASQVTFLGWLPAADKHRFMSRAHALLMTSVREGWGLAVSEANACGTPAVVYNVPGLRDAVKDKITGIVVDPTPSSLAEGMLTTWKDAPGYRRLATEAKRWSTTLSFDSTATVMRDVIRRSLVSQQPLVDSATGAGTA
jgi:glycosyltransferase involved in cell wall biosynthesis